MLYAPCQIQNLPCYSCTQHCLRSTDSTPLLNLHQFHENTHIDNFERGHTSINIGRNQILARFSRWYFHCLHPVDFENAELMPTVMMSTSPPYHKPPAMRPSPSQTSKRAPESPRKPQQNPRVAPYMVALSGWPEPMYIDTQTVGPVRSVRSRSGTPTGSISGLVGEAVEGHPVADKEIGVKISVNTVTSTVNSAYTGYTEVDMSKGQTTPPSRGPTITEALYPYLRSNTRPSSSSPTPTSDPAASTSHRFPAQPQSSKHASSSGSNTTTLSHTTAMSFKHPSQSYTAESSSPRLTKFADPRLTPRASFLGRQGGHLRVAPSWTNSAPSPAAARVLLNTYQPTPVYSSIRTPQPSDGEATDDSTDGEVSKERSSDYGGRARGVGGRHLELGSINGRTRATILRSTPEVYPPPRRNSGGYAIGGPGWAGKEAGVGVVTEVYPRDPENSSLWPGVEGRREAMSGTDTGGHSGTATPTRISSRASSPSRSQPASSGVDRRNMTIDQRFPASVLSPERQDGWSPTVPWAGEGPEMRRGSKRLRSETSNVRAEVDDVEMN